MLVALLFLSTIYNFTSLFCNLLGWKNYSRVLTLEESFLATTVNPPNYCFFLFYIFLFTRDIRSWGYYSSFLTGYFLFDSLFTRYFSIDSFLTLGSFFPFAGILPSFNYYSESQLMFFFPSLAIYFSYLPFF